MTSISDPLLSQPLPLKEEETFELFSNSPPSSTLTSHYITLLKRQEALISSFPSTSTERTSSQNRTIFLLSQKGKAPPFPVILPSVLQREECASLLNSVREYTRDYGWTQERHSAFPTTDIPVRELPEQTKEWVERIIWERVVRDEISKRYDFHPTGRDLAFRDLFIVRYLAVLDAQRSLPLHTDGALFSFNILLNSPDEFEGGGTFFEGDGTYVLQDTRGFVVQIGRGDAVVHESRSRHAGVEIVKGERILLVGFVDTVCKIKRDECVKKI